MRKEEKKGKKILNKLLNPYLVMIIDEETFEEQTQMRVSRIKIIFIGLFFIFLLSALVFSSIAFTPIREYIPGYESSELRKNAVQNLFLTDSLIQLYNKNLLYLNSVKKVLSEDIPSDDFELLDQNRENQTQIATPLKNTITEDSLLRVYVSQQDKYNPNINENRSITDFLFPPVNGSVSQQYDFNNSHYAVDIAVNKNTPKKAIADGIVVFSEWTAETGFVIILEHNSGMLSVYKHNSVLRKKQGDFVTGGEVIGIAGNTGQFSTGYHLHFELWIDGYPMNPENFFNFSIE